MPRAQRLKVYRTPIDFHDAYVAAPSRKAALAAWGSDVDLFARGVAEVVDDEELTAEPLANPGEVIRRSRGSIEEQMAALPPELPRAPKRGSDPADPSERPIRSRPARRRERGTPADRASPQSSPVATPPSKPRPSRKPIEVAERALEEIEARHHREKAALREEEATLARRRRDAERRHEGELSEAEAELRRAREAYAKELERG